MAHRSAPARPVVALLVAALLVAALLLGACASTNPTVEPGPCSPAATPGVVLDQAQDVAGRLESREAELEALIP